MASALKSTSAIRAEHRWARSTMCGVTLPRPVFAAREVGPATIGVLVRRQCRAVAARAARRASPTGSYVGQLLGAESILLLVDRAGPDQHAALGRGVVRRDRPRRDLASSRRDHRSGAAGAAHPALVEPARHGARRPARGDRRDRPGRASRCGRSCRAGSRWCPRRCAASCVAARDAPGVRDVRRIFGGYERWRALHRTTGLFVAAGFAARRARRDRRSTRSPVLRWSYVAIGGIGVGVLRLPRAAGALLPLAARLPGRGGPRRSTTASSRSRCARSAGTSTSSPASSRWSTSRARTAGTGIRSRSPARPTRASSASRSRRSATTPRACSRSSSRACRR